MGLYSALKKKPEHNCIVIPRQVKYMGYPGWERLTCLLAVNSLLSINLGQQQEIIHSLSLDLLDLCRLFFQSRAIIKVGKMQSGII